MRSIRWLTLLPIIGVLAFGKGPRPDRTSAALMEATGLDATADSLEQKGQYTQAELLYERSLAIREKALGPHHLGVAMSLNNLASLYLDEDKYPQAEPLLKRSLAIVEKALGPESPDLAACLNNLGRLYRAQDLYMQAEPLYKRAIAIMEKTPSSHAQDLAMCLDNLADLYNAQTEYSQAESLYKRSLAIRRNVLGPDHPDVAASMNRLAMLYVAQGRYAEAEPLLNRSLAIRESVLGPQDPNVATSLNNLALLYVDQGGYRDAESLLKRSLAIYERVLGPKHSYVAGTLNNLAEVYRSQGRYEQAEPLYKRSLAINEEALGPDHPEVATGLNNLGLLCLDQGQNEEAETLFKRSLAIREKSLAPDDPHVAMSLASLGGLYLEQGQCTQAEPLLKRSLAISEKRLGPQHPDVASALESLAACYGASGHYRDALMSLTRGMRIEQMMMAGVFDVSSEPVMRDYLATSNSSLGVLLSLALESASVCPDAADSALVWTLRRKTLITETMIRLREAQRLEAEDPAVGWRLEELQGFSARLSRLSMGPTGESNSAGVDSQVVSLRKERDRSEAELDRLVSTRISKDITPNVELDTIGHSMPPGSALVEFVRARVFDFHATSRKRWKEAHYLAFVYTPDAKTPPRMADLGDANEIEKQVRAVRESMQMGYASRAIGGIAKADDAVNQKPGEHIAPELDFGSRSRKLCRLVFGPVKEALGAVQMVYLAPDGELNRLPFEALVDEEGKYLIERYRFAYLTSGRELLESPARAARGTVVFAAPDFDLGTRERKAEAGSLLASAPAQREHPFRGPRSGDVRGWKGWPALPGTAREGEEVMRELEGSSYGPVQMYAGKEAIEEMLKALPAPRVLHIASHGYFFEEQGPLSEDSNPMRAGSFDKEMRLAHIRGTENPLLRSGLVLAGANAAGGEADSLGVDDGWVTAEEVGMLNLHGTELVVLSACETGLGDVRSGEGVAGLRRAFRYAGARTVIMSLFQVSDQATLDLMARFYRGLKQGRGKLEALHQAQLGVMRDRGGHAGVAHPFYWASFILAGDPN